MSRKQALLALAILSAASGFGPPAIAADHPDAILNYFTCDGSAWTARWSGNGFQHTPRNTGTAHPDTVLHYQTWDRSCWEASWDESRAAFLHKPLRGGSSHYDYILNYIDWGGGRWTGFRTREGWFHIDRGPIR